MKTKTLKLGLTFVLLMGITALIYSRNYDSYRLDSDDWPSEESYSDNKDDEENVNEDVDEDKTVFEVNEFEDSDLEILNNETDNNSYLRSKQEIIEKWKVYQPTFTGSPYSVEFSDSYPYTTGILKNEFLMDGLNMVNFCRYLAYLPDDIEMDEDKNDLGQHGAVLLYALQDLTHSPSQPSDMSDDFYSQGYASCSSANIGWGHSSISHSIKSYMQDSSTGNMDRVGHRRWILNPSMQYIGFGYAERLTTTQVFDGSRTETVDYEAIKWPSEGYFPVDFFDTYHVWSVSLNPSIYKTAQFNNITVTVERESDGEEWTLNSRDNSTSTDNEYFNVNTSGYGIANCIIFRPDDEVTIISGEIYHVSIDGIERYDGSDDPIEYTVEFFSLN